MEENEEEKQEERRARCGEVAKQYGERGRLASVQARANLNPAKQHKK